MARKTPDEELLANLEAPDDGGFTRPIGTWTLEKLAVLHLYISAFASACRRASGGYYVDGLAGPGLARVRGAKQPPEFVWGSPLIALESRPQLQRCVFLEKNRRAVEALRKRVEPYGRRASVRRGDVNVDLVPLIRRSVPGGAPCFCLLDPEGTELHWRTISEIAALPGRKRKPELLILFPLEMGILRLLTTRAQLEASARSKLNRTFGTQQWESIYNARLGGQLSTPAATDAYLELYKSQVEKLGYAFVDEMRISAPTKPGGSRRALYHLVFATDHRKGHEIMRSVFERGYALDFPVTQQLPMNI